MVWHDYVSREDILKTVENNDNSKDIVNELFNTFMSKGRGLATIVRLNSTK